MTFFAANDPHTPVRRSMFSVGYDDPSPSDTDAAIHELARIGWTQTNNLWTHPHPDAFGTYDLPAACRRSLTSMGILPPTPTP